MPSLMSLLWFVLVGLFAGWLAGVLTKGKGFGWVGNLVVGVLGALLGGVLLRLLQFRTAGPVAELISAVVGSVVLLFLIGMINRRS